MKNIILFLAAICLAMVAYTQNEANLPKTDMNVDEVSVALPEFTGITNYAEVQKFDKADLIKHYLATHVQYPREAMECQSQGTEVIKFTVTKNGELENIEIVNHVCPAIDNEMMRVLKSTDGMWKPGIRNGEIVDMDHEVYLTFSMCCDKEQTEKVFTEKMTTLFKSGTKQMYAKKNFKRAERILDDAIALWPFEANVLLHRGICRYENGNREGAVEDWDRLHSLTGIEINHGEMAQEIRDLDGYKEYLTLYQK